MGKWLLIINVLAILVLIVPDWDPPRSFFDNLVISLGYLGTFGVWGLMLLLVLNRLANLNLRSIGKELNAPSTSTQAGQTIGIDDRPIETAVYAKNPNEIPAAEIAGEVGESASGPTNDSDKSAALNMDFEVQLGELVASSGTMKFAWKITKNGARDLEIYAYDQNDMRKSGVYFLLNRQQFSRLKEIIQKAESVEQELNEKGLIK